MTSQQLELSARIIEAELRRIRDHLGWRDVAVSLDSSDLCWYATDAHGNTARRDTLLECVGSVVVKQRQAAK